MTPTTWLQDVAYVRLPFSSSHWRANVMHGGGLAFVDVDTRLLGDDAQGATRLQTMLQQVPAHIYSRASTFLFRWTGGQPPDVYVELVDAWLQERGAACPVGAIVFEVGRRPRIVWGASSGPDDDGRLLARARQAELRALLDWGHAIWRPGGYHYQLPSGHHSDTFVRAAEMLRDPRAARVIATWLFGAVSPDQAVATTFVTDSGTLSPVVTELRIALEAAGWSINDVRTLDTYPVSRFQFQQLLRADEDSWVLGLVSVSATGTLTDTLETTLRRTVGDAYRLEQLISRSPNDEATAVDSASDAAVAGRQAPWVSIGHDLGRPAVGAVDCEHCRDPARARLVRINPVDMQALMLPEPTLLVPSTFDARRNNSLWSAYDGLHGEGTNPAVSMSGPTNTRRLDATRRASVRAMYFEPALLLRSDPRALVAERVQQLQDLPSPRRRETPDVVAKTLDRVRGEVDAVVVLQEEGEIIAEHLLGVLPQDDEDQAGMTEGCQLFVNALEPLVQGTGLWVLPPGHGPPRPIGAEQGTPTGKVALLTLGVRTGLTLQQAFLRIRDAWPETVLNGIVLHAHPDDDQTWQSLQNNFRRNRGANHLLALWLTFLPDRAPLEEERDLLDGRDDAPGVVEEVASHRCNDEPAQVLWGPPDPQLRPNSYYGRLLHAPTTFAAVGAAMQSARLDIPRGGAPVWAMFDLPKIFRSYFDGMILASVLRWATPAECWWGADPDRTCELVLREVKGRLLDDWPLLLPELLLASAAGKLPSGNATQLLLEEAEGLLNSGDEAHPWVELGRFLVQRQAGGEGDPDAGRDDPPAVEEAPDGLLVSRGGPPVTSDDVRALDDD